jgi:hypothetical protein
MKERRQLPRDPVYYGATLAFNARKSTFACLVRNLNDAGAKVEIDCALTLPDEVDFVVERKQLSGKARLIWRDQTAAGLSFSTPLQQRDATPSDLARRLRASKRANDQLRARIEQLSSG